MNRHQFSKVAAEKCGFHPDRMEKFIGSLTDIMTELLTNGETISLQGFGSFKLVDVKAHPGRNPHTGEEIHIPDMKGVRFTPTRSFKEKIKESAKETQILSDSRLESSYLSSNENKPKEETL